MTDQSVNDQKTYSINLSKTTIHIDDILESSLTLDEFLENLGTLIEIEDPNHIPEERMKSFDDDTFSSLS